MKEKQYFDLQRKVAEMEYDSTPGNQLIYSANKTEELQKTNSLGAALYAAKQLQDIGGHDPKLLITVSYKQSIREQFVYAVAAYGSTYGFRTIGKSDGKILEHCPTPIFFKEDLANTYAQSLRKENLTPTAWSIVYLSDIEEKYDWKNAEENISGIYDELLKMHGRVGNMFR